MPSRKRGTGRRSKGKIIRFTAAREWFDSLPQTEKDRVVMASRNESERKRPKPVIDQLGIIVTKKRLQQEKRQAEIEIKKLNPNMKIVYERILHGCLSYVQHMQKIFLAKRIPITEESCVEIVNSNTAIMRTLNGLFTRILNSQLPPAIQTHLQNVVRLEYLNADYEE